jgi:glycosyltransferase involved in cell wall biosynthesis
MYQDKNFQVVFLWRQNDWGLYYRRNEAWFHELSQRCNVSRSLHVEQITLASLIKLFFAWINAQDPKIKKSYYINLKKSIAIFPLKIDKNKDIFIFGVVAILKRDIPILRNINQWFLNIQGKIINRHFKKSEHPVVLFIYPPANYISNMIKEIQHELLIADLVDDTIARNQFSQTTQREYLDIYKDLLPRCDIIFSTSPAEGSIFPEITSKDIIYLPNGVDSYTSYTKATNSYKPSSPKTVGYIGGINQECDTELFEYQLNHFTNIEFIIIGFIANHEGIKEKFNNLTKIYKNLKFLGQRHYSEIPYFLSSFDVLINIKKDDYTTQGGESIKIYQYLATGKPIVSTPVPPAEDFSQLIYVALDKEEFAQYLNNALKEDDSILQQRRIQAAKENSWSKRVDIVNNTIQETLLNKSV